MTLCECVCVCVCVRVCVDLIGKHKLLFFTSLRWHKNYRTVSYLHIENVKITK